MNNKATLYQFTRSQDVTPDDDNNLEIDGGTNDGGALVARGLSIEVAGDVSYVNEAGDISIAKNLVAGVIYPFRLVKVRSTGTDATGIQVHF